MCPVSLLVWGSLRLAPIINCGQLLPYSTIGNSVFITYIYECFNCHNQLWSTPSLQYCREDCMYTSVCTLAVQSLHFSAKDQS